MRLALSLLAIFLFFITTTAQSRTISKVKYEQVIQLAVSKTNAAYPVILTVTTNFIEKGKTILTMAISGAFR